MHEFDLIQRYFAPLAGQGALGLLDDAAWVPVPSGKQLVITTDTLVEAVHFFAHDDVELLARKLLRVNLSDLAAKGAVPYGYFLALTLPKHTPEEWFNSFCNGLAADQAHYGFSLLGGDTTTINGPMVLSLTALGLVDEGRMIQRSGAKIADDVYVTGTIGDATLGLQARQQQADDHCEWQRHYLLPKPPVKLGTELNGIATAAMDISDGLIADAQHLAKASDVKLVLQSDSIPLSEKTTQHLAANKTTLQALLTGGDDYQILFTAPKARSDSIKSLAQKTNSTVTKIGVVEQGQDVVLLGAEGERLQFNHTGWKHF